MLVQRGERLSTKGLLEHPCRVCEREARESLLKHEGGGVAMKASAEQVCTGANLAPEIPAACEVNDEGRYNYWYSMNTSQYILKPRGEKNMRIFPRYISSCRWILSRQLQQCLLSA